MGTETLVHDTVHRKVHVLNASAARILELCDGKRDVETITGAISAETGAPHDRVRADIERALGIFRDLRLLDA